MDAADCVITWPSMGSILDIRADRSGVVDELVVDEADAGDAALLMLLLSTVLVLLAEDEMVAVDGAELLFALLLLSDISLFEGGEVVAVGGSTADVDIGAVDAEVSGAGFGGVTGGCGAICGCTPCMKAPISDEIMLPKFAACCCCAPSAIGCCACAICCTCWTRGPMLCNRPPIATLA